jgi:hypothetical protein
LRKLFLDDVRNPPDSTWEVVRSYNAFVDYINTNGVPDLISFDHDLSFEHYPFGEVNPNTKIPYETYKEKTGYDCAKWLIENKHLPTHCVVHSMNPVGKENILFLLRAAYKREQS